MQASGSSDAGGIAASPGELSPAMRGLVLTAALLGWMFAGWEISLFVLIARPAILSML